MTTRQTSPTTKPTRILVADDHGVLRAGLRALLSAEADMVVVGEAATGEQALVMAQDLQPEVALLDLSMPGAGGIETTRRLKDILPNVRVLILTVHEDEVLLREAIKVGASGYITKRAIEAELINAVRAARRGEIYVHPSMTHALLQTIAPRAQEVEAPVEALTPRETEVLQLIALGYTNRQISEKLHISVRTVETHRANLIGKLQMESRVELVRYARDQGLLDK